MARSTFASQNVQNTSLTEPFLKFRWSKIDLILSEIFSQRKFSGKLPIYELLGSLTGIVVVVIVVVLAVVVVVVVVIVVVVVVVVVVVSLFVAGAAFAEVHVSLFVAGAAFAEVHVSLFVAGAFGEISNDSRSGKCCHFQ